MRKRELVHLHALLDRILRFVRERDDLPADALAAYEDLDVAPAAVYRSKQAHEDAVRTLTESLADAVGPEGADGSVGVREEDADDPTRPTEETASARGD